VQFVKRTYLPFTSTPSTLNLLIKAFLTLICGWSLNAIAQATADDSAKAPAETLLDMMASRAQSLAQQSYQPPPKNLPDVLKNLTYDRYRAINFREDAALWRGAARFEVQFFHPGFIYQEPVNIRAMTSDGGSTPLPFNPDWFVHYREKIELPTESVKDVGYAGFRVHYPINSEQLKEEFLVFQGASYFRLVGPGQLYGMSARGLAIDTAAASGEEFPAFREFWLVQPEAEATRMNIIALLDSPSLTGAYRFEVAPGASTEMTVEARLFTRSKIGKLGIAPLTSMFFSGENRTEFHDDFRPEVHDSDGVLMQTQAGEWIWRPLSNPPHLRVTSLADENPRGFGLVQRDRNFASYQDLEARYDLRPSLWVTPDGDWGKGRVEVVEIPTNTETNDNIAVYWVPDEPVQANQPLTFRYRLQTFDERLSLQDLAQVVATRNGWAALPGQKDAPPRSKRQFVVDFRSGPLEGLPVGLPLTPVLEASGGSTSDVLIARLPDNATWRVSFKLTPDGSAPVDMRLFLTLHDRRLSEVWSYVWSPEAVR
jgi:glucans biosynthesis protein